MWRTRASHGYPPCAAHAHAELAADGFIQVGRKRVARLMSRAGLAGVCRRKFVVTTLKSDSRQAPDLVERNFTAEAPDRAVGRRYHLYSDMGGLSLSRCRARCVQSPHRRLVDESTLATQLVLDALNMALMTRQARGVIHHSDQGSQYTSIEFGHRCRDAGVRPSMGSVGDAYDNAMCESFFATLECELLARSLPVQDTGRSAQRHLRVHRRFLQFSGDAIPRSDMFSPINYERRHHALAVDPDAHQPAVMLATVKDQPPGRPQDAAVLYRRCAPRPHHPAVSGRKNGSARGRTEENVSKDRRQHARQIQIA